MNSSFHRSMLLSAGLATLAIGCKSRNQPPPPQAPAPVPPAQYGDAPGSEIPAPPEGAGGRFGYTGASAAPGPAGAPPPPAPGPAPAPGMRDVREIDTPKPTEPEPKPAANTPPSASEMPYANAVPGNPLVVTLPGANAALGPISIEKYDSSQKPTGEPLKRGTQVQIPDPNNPGKKIYFKVP